MQKDFIANLGMIAPVYFKTRLYMIRKTSLVSAVVAQPGRALDLLRGEAEDRAVVSSNLTDGTSHFSITSMAVINSKDFYPYYIIIDNDYSEIPTNTLQP